MRKKILSFMAVFMAAFLVIGMVPTSVLAADDDEEVNEDVDVDDTDDDEEVNEDVDGDDTDDDDDVDDTDDDDADDTDDDDDVDDTDDDDADDTDDDDDDADESENEVNKDALVAAIDEIFSIEVGDYDTDSEEWAAYWNAWVYAVDVADDPDATQDQVDAALKALNDAMAALNGEKEEEPEPETKANDKTGLQAEYDKGKTLVESDYTAESWSEFMKAMDYASKVLADDDATQEEVDFATYILHTMMGDLMPVDGENPKTQTEPGPVQSSGSGTGDSGSGSTGSPKTGDTNSVAPWLALLIAGAAVSGFAIKRRQY